MENKISDKEEYAASLAKKAEKAVNVLKITVIVAAVSAVVLSAVSLIIMLAFKKSVGVIIWLGMELGIVIVSAAIVGGVYFYTKKKLRQLDALDEDGEKEE